MDHRSDAPESGPRMAGPRRSRRMPVRSLLVAIDAPEVSDKPWVVDATDLNSLGMGLVLPAELGAGTAVLLSFKLDHNLQFSRVPATVVHYGPAASGGGVRFGSWPEAERLRLLEYLVRHYEALEEDEPSAGQEAPGH